MEQRDARTRSSANGMTNGSVETEQLASRRILLLHRFLNNRAGNFEKFHFAGQTRDRTRTQFGKNPELVKMSEGEDSMPGQKPFSERLYYAPTLWPINSVEPAIFSQRLWRENIGKLMIHFSKTRERESISPSINRGPTVFKTIVSDSDSNEKFRWHSTIVEIFVLEYADATFNIRKNRSANNFNHRSLRTQYAEFQIFQTEKLGF